MSALVDRCAIAIMAKAPRPGHSKTRLCPPLSPIEAATLSGAFLLDMTRSLATAARLAPIDGFVAYAPAGTQAELMPHLAPGTRLLLADGGDLCVDGVAGFGRPLLQTIRDLLALGYGSACVLNSDSPTLPTELLVEAAGSLGEASGRGMLERAVFGATTDGGYYLLGLRTARAALFSGIDWSTERVANQTRDQARREGLEMIELPCWYDVDDAAGLRRLMFDLDRPEIAARAAVTNAALGRMAVRSRLDELA